MKATLKVWRYDPEVPLEPYYQTYTVDVPEYATVLDALLKARDEQDDGLSLRCSCRSAICGSCGMTINNHAQLACKLRLVDAMEGGQEVVCEPMRNMPRIKDLVVDLRPFWSYVARIEPWLVPVPPPEGREYIVPNERMQELVQVVGCIMCGCCVADCTVTSVDKSWLGPAALAKAYRFVGDPRDAHKEQRLQHYSMKGGIWDCTHCFECVQQCPKGVAPMDQIMILRRLANEAGITNNAGSRHGRAFQSSVYRSGHLNEATLPVMSLLPHIDQVLGLLPIGLRMLREGKMPPPVRKPIPGIESVRRVFRQLEDDK